MQNKYYPIKAILLQDFRSVQRFIVDFTESPIVSVVGDNESGKSSVTKALQTLGANMKSRSQKDYIRTDTQGFTLAIKFTDPEDTMVVRMKAKRGVNGFSVQKGDKVVWSCTKMDDGSLPPEIQKYMGFIIEPETQELLNVRTYEDLMMFVSTPNGTNYKVVYNALKVNNILNAKKAGQKDLSACHNRIGVREQKIGILNEQLRKIQLIDLDPLLRVKENIRNSYDGIAKLESANAISDRLNEIDRSCESLSGLSGVGSIDEMLVYALNSAMASKEKIDSLNKNLKELDEIQTLETFDMDLMNLLDTGLKTKEKLDSISDGAYADILDVENVDYEKVRVLNTALELKARLAELDSSECSLIDQADVIDLTTFELLERALKERDKLLAIERDASKYASVSSDIDISVMGLFDEAFEIIKHMSELDKREAETRELLKADTGVLMSFGVEVTTCPNCGETVIIGQEHADV